MGSFRHNPETGEREFVEDAAPAEPAPTLSGPPMREPGWVELFLGPNESGFPHRMPPRAPSPGRRGYRRKSRRRG